MHRQWSTWTLTQNSRMPNFIRRPKMSITAELLSTISKKQKPSLIDTSPKVARLLDSRSCNFSQSISALSLAKHSAAPDEIQVTLSTMPKPKAKTPASEEFKAACSLWRMEFGFHTFQAVQTGIAYLLERKLNSDEPEYYPLSVGLICLYARPFTHNFPVGPLSEDVVPQEHLDYHRLTIQMRHKLFAHADASVMLRADDYPNELVFENDSRGTSFRITRFFAEPQFFQLMEPLLEALIEKTRYHSDKFGKKFNKYFSPSKNIGEFRLNVLDPSAPLLQS